MILLTLKVALSSVAILTGFTPISDERGLGRSISVRSNSGKISYRFKGESRRLLDLRHQNIVTVTIQCGSRRDVTEMSLALELVGINSLNKWLVVRSACLKSTL